MITKIIPNYKWEESEDYRKFNNVKINFILGIEKSRKVFWTLLWKSV